MIAGEVIRSVPKTASSTQQAFSILDEKIALTSEEREEAIYRGKLVSEALDKDNGIRECLITGSLVKSTALSSFSDVDIVAVLSDALTVQESTPERAVNYIAAAIGRHYPQAKISGNAVCIAFEVGPQVDILPALPGPSREGGAQEYLIPDEERREWQRYSPEEQAQQIQAAAVRSGSNFKRLIRLIKWWSKRTQAPISSYEIEAIAKNCFSDSMPALPQALAEFFGSAMLHYQGDEMKKPAIKEALDSLESALDLESSGNASDASIVWRRLLGDEFPTILNRGDRPR